MGCEEGKRGDDNDNRFTPRLNIATYRAKPGIACGIVQVFTRSRAAALVNIIIV